MSNADWKSTSVSRKNLQPIEDLCKESGQTVSFHIERALSNYINDELPVWKAKLKEVQSATQKK